MSVVMTETEQAVKELREVTDAKVEDMDSVMSFDKIVVHGSGDNKNVSIRSREMPDGWKIEYVMVKDTYTYLILYEQQ